MNLTIDFGNSQTKIGIFSNDQLVVTYHFKQLRLSHLNAILRKYQPGKAIISSVVNHPGKIEKLLRQNISLITLNSSTALPFKNLYKTPHTLGKDRIAAVAGAEHIFHKKNLLVIDAGTCITYDFINKNTEYYGGSICPGIEMRFKALHTFTQKLPLIKRPYPILRPTGTSQTAFIGNSTRAAILSGVLFAIESEMDGMIMKYKKQFPGIKTVLTGGDAVFFETRLKNKIFAVPNLVLIGLNRILEYNSS